MLIVGDNFMLKCSICGSKNIDIIYNTPLMPLGGQLVQFNGVFDPELFYPLHYALCPDCSTFQSIESVPSKLLKTENTYVSRTSELVRKRDKEVYTESLEYCKPGDLIVEIGGSDGSFLENYTGFKTVNIEPVDIVARMSSSKQINTICDFLTHSIAHHIVQQYGHADLVVAKHVLELLPDIHQFMKSVKILMASTGRFMIEVPYVKDLIDGNFYDLMAHLRKYHFSFTSLCKLLDMHDLAVEKVTRYDALGGGIRLYAGHKQNAQQDSSVNVLLHEEMQWNVAKPAYYNSCFQVGLRLKSDLINMLTYIRLRNKKVVGYGAGIKASAVLNYCNLNNEYIEYLVDNGKHKQGMLMPGVRLPIYSPSKIDNSIDYVLILAWLHQTEIIESLKEFTDNGGRIIIPTPEVSII